MDGIASKQINEQQQHEQKHFLADTTRHTIQHITIKTRYISYTRLFLHMSRAMSANRLPPPIIVHTNKCVYYNNEQQYNVILMYAFYAVCAAHTTQWPYSNIEHWAMSNERENVRCGYLFSFLLLLRRAHLESNGRHGVRVVNGEGGDGRQVFVWVAASWTPADKYPPYI